MNVAIPQPQAPPPVEDEKAAIMSLLGLQTSTSSGNDENSPGKRKSTEVDDVKNLSTRTKDADQRIVSSPIPPDAEAVIQSNTNTSTTRSATPSKSTNDRPQAISPAPEPQLSNLGVVLTQIGKKRKYHTSVNGQFDDAEDSNILPKLPFAAFGQSQLQRALSPASTEERQQVSIPPRPALRKQNSDENSFPPAPPPHLIKQTSNEYLVAPPILQQQTSAELARQATALAFQRRTMLAAEAGRFPSHFSTILGGGVGAAAGTHGSDVILLERERRLQMEAMLNFQAQMKLAAKSHPHPGLAAALGVPAELAALRASMDTNTTLTPQHVGANSAINAGTTVSKKEEGAGSEMRGEEPAADNALLKAQMIATSQHPHAAPVATNRVVDSEEDEDNSSESSDTIINDCPQGSKEGSPSYGGKKGSKSKAARAFSTKIRYEQYTPPSSWAELTSVSRMPPTKADDKREHPIETVGNHDVLLGRGGLTNTNPGNIRFRALVSKYRMHYCTAPKGDKGALARYLCNYVRANNGRFLQKDSSDHKWYEVGDDKAVMKCGQALREGTAWLIRKALDPSEADGAQPAK